MPGRGNGSRSNKPRSRSNKPRSNLPLPQPPSPPQPTDVLPPPPPQINPQLQIDANAEVYNPNAKITGTKTPRDTGAEPVSNKAQRSAFTFDDYALSPFDESVVATQEMPELEQSSSPMDVVDYPSQSQIPPAVITQSKALTPPPPPTSQINSEVSELTDVVQIPPPSSDSESQLKTPIKGYTEVEMSSTPVNVIFADSQVPNYGTGASYQFNLPEGQPELGHATIQSYRGEFSGLQLTAKSYADQLKEKLGASWVEVDGRAHKLIETGAPVDEGMARFRTDFERIKTLMSLLSDYIDGVHDITLCFKFLEDVIARSNNVVLETRLRDLKKRLCASLGDGRINVAASHELHIGVINEYIGLLRENGFILPDFDDPVSLNSKNAATLFGEMKLMGKPVARESGRDIYGYFSSQDLGIQVVNLPRRIPHNVIGAIDGCKGDCDTNNGPLTWKCRLYGIMEATITSSRSGKQLNSEVVIKYDAPYGGDTYEFTVVNEIVLDAVIDKLGANFPTRNQTGNDYSKVITPKNPYKEDSKYHMAVVALKTLCDKRLFQRFTTDHYSDKIAAVSTTDWYVTIGHLLAYLNGEIPYFPKIFFSGGNSDGYLVYSFDDNGSDELLKRYAYYKEYCDATGSPNGLLRQSMNKYTGEWIKRACETYENTDFEYRDFWDFIQTLAICKQTQGWEEICRNLDDNLNRVTEQLQNPTPTPKDELIKSLMKVPIVVPNLAEFFEQLSEEEDITFAGEQHFSRAFTFGIFADSLSASDPVVAHQTATAAFEELSKTESVHNQRQLREFLSKKGLLNAKVFKLIGAIEMPEFTTKGSGNKQEFSIDIDDRYVSFTYAAKAQLPNVKDYNDAETDNPERQIQINDSSIKVPICAELLIKIAFNQDLIDKSKAKEDASSRKSSRSKPVPIAASELLTKVRERIFDIVKGWLALDEDKKGAFCELCEEAAANTENTQYNAMWRQYPGLAGADAVAQAAASSTSFAQKLAAVADSMDEETGGRRRRVPKTRANKKNRRLTRKKR